MSKLVQLYCFRIDKMTHNRQTHETTTVTVWDSAIASIDPRDRDKRATEQLKQTRAQRLSLYGPRDEVLVVTKYSKWV